MSSPPLAGVRVLDLSRVVSGPLCARLLADLGADVIKVESPEGDVSRTVPPALGGVSAYYAQLNAGKRNVCVDLKAPGAPALVARLAAHCDVFLENFRPGVLARYGLDAPVLRAADPRLIYCSITGWGQDGPWANHRAYAPLVHAEVGMLEMAGRVRGRRPEQEVQQHGDVSPGLLAANAILAALLQRATTGRGQHLDVAMGQALVYVNEWAAVGLQRHEGDHGNFATWTHRNYPLSDGSFVALVGDPIRMFPLWAPRLGADEDLLGDPRFRSEETRSAHFDEVIAALDSLTVCFDNFEALQAVLDPATLAAPLRSVADLAESEWARHRGLTTEVAPGLPVPSAPWRGDDATVGVSGPVAALGEHNRQVLSEVGDYLDTEIDELINAGAVCN